MTGGSEYVLKADKYPGLVLQGFREVSFAGKYELTIQSASLDVSKKHTELGSQVLQRFYGSSWLLKLELSDLSNISRTEWPWR
jgi:hypothetical protein